MFFLSVLPSFTTTNILLQCEDPCIYLIHDVVNHFLTHLVGRFMPVHTTKLADHLSTINLENHKHPKDMYSPVPSNSPQPCLLIFGFFVRAPFLI